MGSIDEAPTHQKLPFIDFSSKPLLELKPGSAYWDSLKSQVREALEEYGSFEASFKPAVDIPTAGIQSDNIFRSVKELFDLDLATKQRRSYGVGDASFTGYIGQHPGYSSSFESFGINNPNEAGEVESFTNALWDQGNPSFSKNVQSWSEKVAKLDEIVRRMIVESFELEKYMDEHMSSIRYQLRVNKYAANSQPHGPEIGQLKAHTDKSLITILCQNEVDGLQIQTKKGDWVKFQPSHASFVILVADSLYAWLNGRVHCPSHRVMGVYGNKPRYSIGLFSLTKTGYVIKAPEELIDQHHPLLFKPFEFKEYMTLAYSTAGKKEASPLHLRKFYGL
ncbi:unnamed protein product [Linum trigynum]|uniref:Fe2OG dioxygenase domain-containing protein n=1 Tax=Linum trigynum TaxID=586398 RepID=A0AAV2EZJ1_9ROSI